MNLVYGVGVNDADYAVTQCVKGKTVRCQAYRAWSGMLERCYSAKLHERRKTYAGVTVCAEWRSFMSFRSWWAENGVKGWQLDKDLLTDSREYSPESCIYIPAWLNSFTIDCAARRGDLPVGVSLEARNVNKYKARCRHPSGVSEYLGNYSLPIEAHNAWINRKLGIADELKGEMDKINPRIYQRVIQLIERKRHC